MPDDTPVLDTIADMTAASIARCGLDADQLILVRLAALAAVDARPVSYLAHIGPSVEAGVTLEQVQDVLVAVAPDHRDGSGHGGRRAHCGSPGVRNCRC